MTPAAPVPRLEPAFDVTATLGPLEDHGVTRAGHRRVVPITGGRVSGLVSGLVDAEILAGGADWQIVRPDGSTEIGRSSSPPRSAGPTACATRPTGSPDPTGAGAGATKIKVRPSVTLGASPRILVV